MNYRPSEEPMTQGTEPDGAPGGGAPGGGAPGGGAPGGGAPGGGAPGGGAPGGGAPAGDDSNAPPDRSNNPTNNAVQRTRSWTGLWVVAISDLVIAVAAIWGVVKMSSASATSSSSIVAILTSAFTAIGTLTTAYFGLKSA